jgi:hypothetical protein
MAEKAKEKESRSVTPWRPFMDLTGWERDMDKMLEDFLADGRGCGGRKDGPGRMKWK